MATRTRPRSTNQLQRNWIIRSLPARSRRALAPELEALTLVTGQVIYEPGHTISHAYFPDDSVISHVCSPTVASALEVALVGREGIAGHAPLIGVPTTVTRLVVQIAGRASRVRIDVLRELVAESEPFRLAVTRFSQALFDQVTLCGSCNMGHTPLERCARWMLMIRDRVDGHDFPVTQEFLAYMLGTSRQTVSAVARAAVEGADRVHARARRSGQSSRSRAARVSVLRRDCPPAGRRAVHVVDISRGVRPCHQNRPRSCQTAAWQQTPGY